jgi:hypothetical protein
VANSVQQSRTRQVRHATILSAAGHFPTSDEFAWGEVGQGLMRTDIVVGVFLVKQLVVKPGRLIGVGRALGRTLVVGVMGPLHTGIQFQGLRR